MPSKKLSYILWHLLVLILALGIPLVVLPSKTDPGKDPYETTRVVFTLMHIGAFYLNAYVLFPRYLLRGRAWDYIWRVVAVCVLILVVYFVTSVMFEHRKPQEMVASLILKFFVSVMILGTATGYSYVEKMIKDQRLQKEQLRTELSFLRSQVSPHFMFNTLNSMVALARKKSDKLEPALIELSNLMHYMLYESDMEKVSLSKEMLLRLPPGNTNVRSKRISVL